MKRILVFLILLTLLPLVGSPQHHSLNPSFTTTLASVAKETTVYICDSPKATVYHSKQDLYIHM
jgi:hypothetical protein